jgi:hypothetical protein
MEILNLEMLAKRQLFEYNFVFFWLTLNNLRFSKNIFYLDDFFKNIQQDFFTYTLNSKTQKYFNYCTTNFKFTYHNFLKGLSPLQFGETNLFLFLFGNYNIFISRFENLFIPIFYKLESFFFNMFICFLFPIENITKGDIEFYFNGYYTYYYSVISKNINFFI